MVRGMDRQAERREATRRRLVDAAWQVFAAEGYEAAAIDRVLAVAGVSKGALYHHFASKEALFAAVFEEAARSAIAEADRRAGVAAAGEDRLTEALLAWVRAVEQEPRRAIMLVEAPRALGWARMREIEQPYAASAMRRGLRAAAGGRAIEDMDLAAALIGAAAEEMLRLRLASQGAWPDEAAMRRAFSALSRALTGASA